jgi:hypothetical protein
MMQLEIISYTNEEISALLTAEKITTIQGGSFQMVKRPNEISPILKSIGV